MKRPANSTQERRGVAIAMDAFESIGMAFREQSVHDYGIDAHVEIVEHERPTGQLIAVQLKSGPSYFAERESDSFVFRIDKKHMSYWLDHALPVIIVLCDTSNKLLYWQRISVDTIQQTGRGFKVLVPRSQRIDSTSIARLQDVATPVVPASRYTVLRTQDVSHGTAKRYSVDVLLNGSVTKADIAAIIRQVTEHQIGSRYYRDFQVESRWSNVDAHVIWTYVYTTLDDTRYANWICSSLWVAPSLPERDAPMRLQGENIGMAITVEWSSRYDVMAKLLESDSISKEEYLREVDGIICALAPLIGRASGLLHDLACNQITLADLVTSLEEMEPKVSDLSERTGRLGIAPIECHDLDNRFHQVVVSAHNVAFPFSKFARNTGSDDVKASLAVTAARNYQEQMVRFKFEREKVT